MKEQIWQIDMVSNGRLEYYNDLSFAEYEEIGQYIHEDTKNIMDLGCGLGRAGINIYHMLDKRPNMFFCDSNFIADKTGGSRFCSNDEVGDYNSIKITEDFVKYNSVNNCKIVDIANTNPFKKLPKMDLIISMYSVGFHFSNSDWFNELLDVISHKTVLIFGLSDPNNFRLATSEKKSDRDLPKIMKKFSSSNIVKGLRDPYPTCDYLILEGFKDS